MSAPHGGGAPVRPLAASDRDDWRRLWTAHLAFHDTALPEKVHASTWGGLMADDPRDVSGLVAVAEGRPVGPAQLLLHRHGWRTGEVCHLQGLRAEPETRGRGVGRALIEAISAAGVQGVYWLTQDHNAQARRLYDRIGRLTPFVKHERG